MASDLALATAVRRLAHAPGHYVAELDEAWSYIAPSGGVLMTVALRAMVEELGDASFRPVSANTVFCAPLPSGPLLARVEVLRKGNVAVQMRAALSAPSVLGAGLEVTATFARGRSGHEARGAYFPEAPPPDECVDAGNDARVGAKRVPRPFYGNFDMRLAQGARIWEPSGWRGGDARWACWYRYRVPQRSANGTFDPLAIPPIADTMPSALANRLGPDRPFFAPSLDLTVHFIEASESEWFLVDARCPFASGGYATADAVIWDMRGKLVARATQTMILRDAQALEG